MTELFSIPKRNEDMYSKIYYLDNKIYENNTFFNNQFYLLKEEIRKLVSQIESDMISSKEFYEIKEQQIKNIETKFIDKIEKESKETNESERRLIVYIDDSYKEIKNYLMQEKNIRDENIKVLTTCI